MPVIEVLRAIMNKRHPDSLIKSQRLRTTEAAVALSKNDCRAIKKFISFFILRECPAFLAEKNVFIYIDTLFFSPDVCRRNDYRPVGRKISHYYALCISANEEANELKIFMGSE